MYSQLQPPFSPQHITPERLPQAEDDLSSSIPPQHPTLTGPHAQLARLHAQNYDWRNEVLHSLRAGGTGDGEERDKVVGLLERLRIGHELEEGLLVEGDGVWHQVQGKVVSSDTERQHCYDASNPLLAGTLLIGNFEEGSKSTFGALQEKGLLPLVNKGFLSILQATTNDQQLLTFILTFRQTYLPHSHLLTLGAPLSLLVQSILSSLTPAPSSYTHPSVLPLPTDSFDHLPPSWPRNITSVQHSSTLLVWSSTSQPHDESATFDLSSLAESLPTTFHETVNKPSSTEMLVDFLPSIADVLLEPPTKERSAEAVVLDILLTRLLTLHALPLPSASSETFLVSLPTTLWTSFRILLHSVSSDKNVGEVVEEMPRLFGWFAEACERTKSGWEEWRRGRGDAGEVVDGEGWWSVCERVCEAREEFVREEMRKEGGERGMGVTGELQEEGLVIPLG